MLVKDDNVICSFLLPYSNYDLKFARKLTLVSTTMHYGVIYAFRDETINSVFQFLKELTSKKVLNEIKVQELVKIPRHDNFFDTYVEKIRKLGEILLELNDLNLEDTSIINLRKILTDKTEQDFFCRILTLLETKSEIKEKLEQIKISQEPVNIQGFNYSTPTGKRLEAIRPYKEIIDTMHVNGQFRQAADLLISLDLNVMVEFLKPYRLDYVLVNTPILTEFERKLAIRNVFGPEIKTSDPWVIRKKVKSLTWKALNNAPTYQDEIYSFLKFKQLELHEKNYLQEKVLTTTIADSERIGFKSCDMPAITDCRELEFKSVVAEVETAEETLTKSLSMFCGMPKGIERRNALGHKFQELFPGTIPFQIIIYADKLDNTSNISNFLHVFFECLKQPAKEYLLTLDIIIKHPNKDDRLELYKWFFSKIEANTLDELNSIQDEKTRREYLKESLNLVS